MYWCMQNGRKNDRKKNEKSLHKIFVHNLGADGRQNNLRFSDFVYSHLFQYLVLSEQRVPQKLSMVLSGVKCVIIF